jgi:hypothetical protein
MHMDGGWGGCRTRKLRPVHTGWPNPCGCPHFLHSGAWDGLKANGLGGAKALGQPRPPVAGRVDDEPGLDGGAFADGPLE